MKKVGIHLHSGLGNQMFMLFNMLSYYIDNCNNVYDHNDIVKNRMDPKIIAKYTKENGKYNIPSLFNKK